MASKKCNGCKFFHVGEYFDGDDEIVYPFCSLGATKPVGWENKACNGYRELGFEELKAKAKAMGYKLIKEKKRDPLLPCICGCKRRTHWYRYSTPDEETYGLECKRCGREVWGYSELGARNEWNRMVINAKKGENQNG